jgi:orotidine-5'-phosphate decarboxylase
MTPNLAPVPSDQIIDAVMARGLHADACRVHALVGWVVMRDAPEYPDRFIAVWSRMHLPLTY